MKLYYATGTISIAVAIALEEAGLDYDTHQLNFAAGDQQSPDYTAINPKGRVPALDVNGTILTETGALLDYIATQTPGLMPTDQIQAAKARSVMYYLASTMHVNHAHKMRGHRWADNESSWQDMTAKVPETMTASAQFVETDCLVGPYILGDTFTLADAYLFMVCTWLPGDGVDLAPFPKLRTFMAAMEARDSVKTIRAKGMLG
ncbi:glutathione S-transferase family protein [Tateyamaria omphalii]|uniref:glutathione S-transferase family protein n=1 Tax=Tateyamaria omphalii TaxID=299262 RepID=UPI001C99AC75|nr:glutathione S-transferase family protein [Tateyamaria omphalii]MBY5933157.1 glutathione S-transferase family protein [Tateyamaria omphalii]